MSNENNDKKNDQIKQGRPQTEETKEKLRQLALERGAHGRVAATRNHHIIVGTVLSKRCAGECKLIKPLTDYGSYKARWDGLNPKCKPCHNINTNKWKDGNPEFRKIQNAKRVKLARSVKTESIRLTGSMCIKCNLTLIVGQNEYLFDFHHTDPLTKEFRISAKSAINMDQIKEELDKCELICKNCHRMEHDER